MAESRTTMTTAVNVAIGAAAAALVYSVWRRSVKEIARELASEMGNKSVGPVRHAEVEEEKHHAELQIQNSPRMKANARVLAKAIAMELVQGAAVALEEEKSYETLGDGTSIVRQRSGLEREVMSRRRAALEIAKSLPEELDGYQVYIPKDLTDALFVGHLVTDLDSIAGAIGAADLYGGIACRASDLNSETKFAVEKWGVAVPPKIEDMLKSYPDAGICLVDHQQSSQVNKSIPIDRIVGVIDHHALQSETIVTGMPIHLDIRPWGSMSTIISHSYLMFGRRPPPEIAGMLLCAILSDTLNLAGPTTTEWDKMMVAILAAISGVSDINFLAQQQFKAKSRELATLSPTQLVCGDQKEFTLTSAGGDLRIGFAVVETTDDEVIMEKHSQLVPEISAVKRDRKLDMLYLAVVNIVEMRSNLLLVSPAERELAQMAFERPVSADGTIMNMGNRVSRKKEFVPPLTAAIQSFDMGKFSQAQETKDGAAPKTELFVDPMDPSARVQRRMSAMP